MNPYVKYRHSSFDEALQVVLAHEGGYVNDPADPGGETNYGITVGTARDHGYRGSMRSIPLDVVAQIYRAGYWDRCGCDSLPAEIRLPLFDGAVNSGPMRSIQWLQMALGVADDGILGPVTLAAAQAHPDPSALAARIMGHRLDFLSRLRHWGRFGRGWARRVASTLRVLAVDDREES